MHRKIDSMCEPCLNFRIPILRMEQKDTSEKMQAYLIWFVYPCNIEENTKQWPNDKCILHHPVLGNRRFTCRWSAGQSHDWFYLLKIAIVLASCTSEHKWSTGTRGEHRSHETFPIGEHQKKSRRNHEAIINTVKYHLLNARIESAKTKIALTVRMAYRFGNIDDLLDSILLRCFAALFICHIKN